MRAVTDKTLIEAPLAARQMYLANNDAICHADDFAHGEECQAPLAPQRPSGNLWRLLPPLCYPLILAASAAGGARAVCV